MTLNRYKFEYSGVTRDFSDTRALTLGTVVAEGLHVCDKG